MVRTILEAAPILNLESAGILMTPEEFDAAEQFDENFRYELVHGVLVVHAIPLPEETSPNELLGYYLLTYKEAHPNGSVLDLTLPQQYVRPKRSRRLADRLIWIGLGRVPNLRRDPASIAIEFVSAGKRNRRRDYIDKLQEYREAGIKEYWIIDRFQRTLTVIHYRGRKPTRQVFQEGQTYESSLLPGFEVPLARLLAAADQFSPKRRKV